MKSLIVALGMLVCTNLFAQQPIPNSYSKQTEAQKKLIFDCDERIGNIISAMYVSNFDLKLLAAGGLTGLPFVNGSIHNNFTWRMVDGIQFGYGKFEAAIGHNSQGVVYNVKVVLNKGRNFCTVYGVEIAR